MTLYNTLSREQLLRRLEKEDFNRRTLSFYRYVLIENPRELRDELYRKWDEFHCLGRIYVAREGINAQMNVPEHHVDAFLQHLDSVSSFRDMPIKWAVEDDSRSFYKLTVKVRPKIVADGLDDGAYNVTNVGTHLEAEEFHRLADEASTVVVDMRNHYESEVGRFTDAYCPDADTFNEAIRDVTETYKDQKDRKFLLYCTGGIRCEKASAYLKHQGFSDVNQLYGGIIEYARFVKEAKVPSKFTGKNFVFDNRLGERIDGQVISRCHQCGAPADSHTNCANDACHLLFIQCSACAEKYKGCCTEECRRIIELPLDEQKKIRQIRHAEYAESKIFKSRLRPHLMGS